MGMESPESAAMADDSYNPLAGAWEIVDAQSLSSVWALA
ncbi:hypothetical protein MCBRY_001606 [Methylocystis bryophila]